jgi:hypothetical protein
MVKIMDNNSKLFKETIQVFRDIRVLRYTSPDEELKGFRVHLFEKEWDKLEKAIQDIQNIQGMKKKEDEE